MRRRAFTLTEVVIAVLVLGIMAAAMTLRPDSAKQTAKMEAERIAAVIRRMIEGADRTHSAFWFMTVSNNLYAVRSRTYSTGAREKLDFNASAGCSFTSSPARLGYNTESNTSYAVISTNTTPAVRVEVSSQTQDKAKYAITVTGADKSTCYVYIFAE